MEERTKRPLPPPPAPTRPVPKLPEPKVPGITAWGTLYWLVWHEANRSIETKNSSDSVYQRLYADLDAGHISSFKELAQSPVYGEMMLDILFIEKEIQRSLIAYDDDPDSACEHVWLLDAAYGALKQCKDQ